MGRDGVLDISEVMDESRKIRPKFPSRYGSCWLPDGRYKVLRENGERFVEITYCNGVVHGPFIDFWSNGRVAGEGQYTDGKQDGVWHFYNENGSIQAIILFKEGKVINDSIYIYDGGGTLLEIIQSNQFMHPEDMQ